MINKFVSVIIPTYNRANEVTRAINSVLEQTYKYFELIVVDDGSTDNTRDVLATYINRFQYIYQENQGVSSARNTGIKAAKGEWVAFLDSDDEWLPEKLSIQIESLNENVAACLHTTNHFVVTGLGMQYTTNFDITGFSIADKCRLLLKPLEYQIKFGIATIQSVVVRRASLFTAGLFDQKMRIYEDQDLMCRLALLGPWLVSNLVLSRAHCPLRQEHRLSHLANTDPLGSASALVYVYEKLALNDKLSIKERILLESSLRTYRSALASELMYSGRKREAREVLKKGMTERIASGLFTKYLLSFLPSFLIIRIVAVWKATREKLASIRL